MKVREVTSYLESIAPLSLQESYDNAGLSVGSPEMDIKGILICLDVTEEVVDEAIEKEANLIVSHHPVIFGGLKKINGRNMVEKIVIKCIKHDIALYGIHTNLDSIKEGVSGMIAKKLKLKQTKVLSPAKSLLRKLVTFCPIEKAEEVRQAIFAAGAGYLGNYSDCSFNNIGTGTFKANEGAKPYVGEINKIHHENETRIETVYPVYHEKNIIKALLENHPYEEVAYDIYPLENEFEKIGMGIIGKLDKPIGEKEFIQQLKNSLKAKVVRHTALKGNTIKTVAVCGGSGSFLITKAMSQHADIFISGDIKYHDFFIPEGRMIIADIGHYESEQFTKELLFNILKEKFTNFAVSISKVNTNPIQYS
jgi:dinuclear metal center YbgI/SA1388 family protein